MKYSSKASLLLAALAPFATFASPAAAAPTMCAKGDPAIYSCSLEGAQKMVSMCAAGDVANGKGHYYYAYGHDASHPELVYPADDSQGAFTRTHLMFAGGTGGFAYAFANAGFKYVIYSISGANNLEKQGLVVFKDGETKPVKNTRCRAGSVSYAEDRSLLRPTFKWASDPMIESLGIPAP